MTSFKWLALVALAMALVFGGCKSDAEEAAEKEAAALEAAAKEAKKKIAEKKAAKKTKDDEAEEADGDDEAEKADKKATAEKPERRKKGKGPTARKKSDPWAEERAARAAKHAEGAVALRPEQKKDEGERALGPRKDLPPPPAEAAVPAELAKEAAEKEAAAKAAAAKAAALEDEEDDDDDAAPAVTPKPFTGKPLAVDHLLSLEDVVKVTGTKVRLQKDSLEGVPLSAGYNNLYFREKKAHKFGVALQIWKDANMRDARWRFKQLAKTYPNVTENTAVTPKTFFAYWDELYYLVFLVQSERTVAVVSCGNHICTPETLLDLARQVHDKLSSK